jgi:CTP synthase (UTP-ammonia lyase)
MTRVAIVGDKAPHVRAHRRIPDLLASLMEDEGLLLDAYWVPTPEAGRSGLEEFDAIWLAPGSPYRSEAGAVRAVHIAREHRIPFLGTCAGFQHAMLEFARHECGLPGIGHAENDPLAERHLIVPLVCSLVAREGAVQVQRGSFAEHVLGVEVTMGRYQCAYGLSSAYLDVLQEHGMRFSGVDHDGEARIAELPGHPFFLATLFQPELAEEHERPRAIITALATAAAAHARRRQLAPV